MTPSAVRTERRSRGLCVADVWLGNCVRQCTWRDTAVLVEGGAAGFVGFATEHRLGRLLEAGLSLRRNAEIDIEIHGTRVGGQMAEMFAVDRADCAAFALHEWYARSPLRRVLMRLVALADPLM